ncbi:hypothetical protein GO755_04585 [Spirosoma sp. HMF4905]|uniref:Uncharacterized protein n=1 Tax=Spirosoma arboris TaxID=2682092 RepID=A0A7K1S658_9BACT|nr:hypothetical protein [Spirosoma arboris]MVM29299.1 hypothetical protein [Spirosoma arboris]
MSLQNPQPDTSSQEHNKSTAYLPQNQAPPVKINYYRLLEWFWEEVPYRPGYKSEYGSTFLAIIDSINRNAQRELWRETAIDFDRLINKIRCSKRMYYEALKWLRQEDLLLYIPGRNEHAMARFHVGALIPLEVQKRTSSDTATIEVEVQKRTSSDTATIEVEVQKRTSSDTSTAEAVVQKCTSSATSTSTSGAPINKDIPITYIPTTNKAPVVPTFDVFWNAYDYKVGRKDCQKKWDRLAPEDKVAILTVLPAYVQATPEGGFPARKHPLTFLNGESWKDEDIGKIRLRATSSTHAPGTTDRPQSRSSPKGLSALT